MSRVPVTLRADKTGFITANIALALARDDIGPSVRAFLADLD